MKFIVTTIMAISLSACMDTTRASSLETASPLEVIKKCAWISDKSATVKWIQSHRPGNARNEKLLAIFGKMIITYTDDSATTRFDGHVDTQPQRVIGQTSREIAFMTKDLLEDRDVICVLEMDEDLKGYWIYNSLFDIREHFIPTQAPQ